MDSAPFSRVFKALAMPRAAVDPFSAPVLAVRSTAVSGRKIINIREHASWTGAATRRFFLEPQQTFQRQYEALRAIFVEDEPLERVAERFGYKPSTLQSMASRLRADCRRGVTPPFFSPTAAGGPSGPVRAEVARAPETPEVADCRELNLDARPHDPLARRGRLPLPAPPGPARLRSPRRRGRVSRLGDGPRHRRLALAPGAEAARQGTTQSYRRLQLRRGPRPVRRPQRPPQEVVRHRLLLPGRPRPATGPVAGVGQGPGPGDLPRARGVLARLPPDPLPRRPRRRSTATTCRCGARPGRAC